MSNQSWKVSPTANNNGGVTLLCKGAHALGFVFENKTFNGLVTRLMYYVRL